ncbi:hypothetical protein MAR_025607 [Mya arenaria]|uniref:Sushi domain-containing protein n=1 Tax=Mya arenaria TaxID=6604 RepID=A0ABY7ER41_MYAAR|nr:hypothetical protein MAR_025607 [Mya arenaria]
MSRTFEILFRLIVLIYGIPSNESTTGESVDDWTQCPPPSSRFKVLINVSIKQCTTECETRPACVALGYLRRPSVCELYDKPADGGGPGSSTATSHCIFVNRENIKQQDGDSCNCPTWSVCDRKSNTCTIKECKPLRNVQNGKILGNRYDVGARLRVICDAGYKEDMDITTLTCADCGLWSHVPSCVPKFKIPAVVTSPQTLQGFCNYFAFNHSL